MMVRGLERIDRRRLKYIHVLAETFIETHTLSVVT
jgi:hypothetical protein